MMKRALLSFVLLLLTVPAFAGDVFRLNRGAAILATAALNGSQASLTSSAFCVAGADWVRIRMVFTAAGTATGFTLNCEEANKTAGEGPCGDEPTTGWRLMRPIDGVGNIANSEPLFKWEQDANLDSSQRIGVSTYEWMRCYGFGSGTPSAPDTLALYGWLK